MNMASTGFMGQTPPNAVPSGQRKACYKCGNIGHYAENCDSVERLCYNCKQPGHESKNCPAERTNVSKQCYNCQSMGHISAECPRPLPRVKSCYNCDGRDHIARDCPSHGMNYGGRPGGGGGMPGPGYGNSPNHRATCYKCGGPNHFARDCQSQAPKCYSCGTLGHVSKDCPHPQSPQTKKCYGCGQPGHISKDCPAAAGSGMMAPVPGNAAAPPAQVLNGQLVENQDQAVGAGPMNPLGVIP